MFLVFFWVILGAVAEWRKWFFVLCFFGVGGSERREDSKQENMRERERRVCFGFVFRDFIILNGGEAVLSLSLSLILSSCLSCGFITLPQ